MAEDHRERINRELMELLNELRVALPGVQVLFAFLLTVPFTQRFERLRDPTVDVFFAAVILTAVSSVLLIAPSAHHRMRFRQHSKEQMLRVANVSAVAGLFTLALAVGSTVYVITDLVYGSGRARLVGPLVAGFAVLAWFLVPLLYRSDSRIDPEDEGEDQPAAAGAQTSPSRVLVEAGRD